MSPTQPPTILFVHPLGYSAKNAKDDVSRMANIMPPLGLASIAAYLEEQNIHNDIIDCYANPASDSLIQEYLQLHKPPFIAFSCTTSSFYDGVRLAKLARKIHPAIKVIFGGVHVSAMKEETLKAFKEIDYTVVGEGEETLRQLLLGTYDALEEIEGLTFRQENGTVVFTGYRENLLDLDSLPFPAYKTYRLPRRLPAANF